MFLLAFDTTGPIGSVALMDMESGVIYEKQTKEPMAHLKMLMPLTEELFRENQIEKSQVAAVCASVGPGSYTGIRIGVSTARAISQVLGIPCISVPTLEIFKYLPGGAKGVIFNARRGQVYGAVFGANGEEVLSPGPYMLDEVLSKAKELEQDVTLYGDGIDAYAESEKYGSLFEGFTLSEETVRYQTAALTVRMGLDKFQKGEVVNPEECTPLYMRKTEAEQKLADGSLAKAREAKLKKFMGR